MIVSLGTGSTAKFMVGEIGRRVKERRIVNRGGYYFKKNRETTAFSGIPFKKGIDEVPSMDALRLMAPMKSALIFRNQRRWRCLTILKKLWPLIQRNVFGLWINQKWWTI